MLKAADAKGEWCQTRRFFVGLDQPSLTPPEIFEKLHVLIRIAVTCSYHFGGIDVGGVVNPLLICMMRLLITNQNQL